MLTPHALRSAAAHRYGGTECRRTPPPFASDLFHRQRRGRHLVGDLATQEAANLARHVESRASHAHIGNEFDSLGHQVDEVSAGAGIFRQL